MPATTPTSPRRVTALLAVPVYTAVALGCAGTHMDSGPGGGGGGGPSSSGSGAAGGSGATGRGGFPVSTTSGAGGVSDTCSKMDFMVDKKPANVLLVQDRSGSMDNTPTGQSQTKWQLTTAAMIAAITQTDSAINWGLKTFPEGTSNCALGGTIDVMLAPANATRVVGSLNGAKPDGDGTPTGEAVHAALGYMAGVQLPGDKYLVLSTDGDPTCSGSPSPIEYAVSQLQMGVSMGIKTFVIGIGTGSTSGPNLTRMADAGGMPRAVINPLDTRYYLANSQQELAEALAAITGQVISCTFPLANPPPLANGVHVVVNGTEIYNDPNHASGWDYTDRNYTGLTVYGAQCDVIKSGSAQVHVTYDCVPVIPT